jgi:hypothetical protein
MMVEIKLLCGAALSNTPRHVRAAYQCGGAEHLSVQTKQPLDR